MGLADYDYDNMIGYDIPRTRKEFLRSRKLEKACLLRLTDIELLNKIIHEAHAKNYINNIVPNGRFKAYDIAKDLQPRIKAGGKLTKRQREALANVYAHYLA